MSYLRAVKLRGPESERDYIMLALLEKFVFFALKPPEPLVAEDQPFRGRAPFVGLAVKECSFLLL
jgi:hypothetical protein